MDFHDTELQLSAAQNAELVTVKGEPPDSEETTIKEEIVENLECVLEDKTVVKQEESETSFICQNIVQSLDCQTSNSEAEDNYPLSGEPDHLAVRNEKIENNDMCMFAVRDEGNMPSTSVLSCDTLQNIHTNVMKSSVSEWLFMNGISECMTSNLDSTETMDEETKLYLLSHQNIKEEQNYEITESTTECQHDPFFVYDIKKENLFTEDVKESLMNEEKKYSLHGDTKHNIDIIEHKVDTGNHLFTSLYQDNSYLCSNINNTGRNSTSVSGT